MHVHLISYIVLLLQGDKFYSIRTGWPLWSENLGQMPHKIGAFAPIGGLRPGTLLDILRKNLAVQADFFLRYRKVSRVKESRDAALESFPPDSERAAVM